MQASFIQLLWPKNGLWKPTQTVSDVHFSEHDPCTPFLSPTWKHTEDDIKTQRSDSIPVRRQNKLRRKITPDSSSRVRNLKHPSMCTASSRAPGGGEMDANLPAVLSSCSSCQQTKLPQIQFVYGDWHSSLWDRGIRNTHLYGWRQALLCLVGRANRVKVAEAYRHLRCLGKKSDSKDGSRGDFYMCCRDDDTDDDQEKEKRPVSGC